MNLFRKIGIVLKVIKILNTNIRKNIISLTDDGIYIIEIKNKEGDVLEAMYLDKERCNGLKVNNSKKIHYGYCFDKVKYILLTLI